MRAEHRDREGASPQADAGPNGGPSHNLHMADTQALQCGLMLIGCNESYLRAWLAAHRREVVVWERARALAREPDRALRGRALERHCIILPTTSLAVHAAYLSRARPGFPGHVRRDLPGPSRSSVRD